MSKKGKDQRIKNTYEKKCISKPEKITTTNAFILWKNIKYVHFVKQEIKGKLRPQKAEIAIYDG